MSKNLDILKKDITKNLLQNKLCSNCKFMNHKQSAEWCHYQKNEPNAGTCSLWEKRNYTLKHHVK